MSKGLIQQSQPRGATRDGPCCVTKEYVAVTHIYYKGALEGGNSGCICKYVSLQMEKVPEDQALLLAWTRERSQEG